MAWVLSAQIGGGLITTQGEEAAHPEDLDYQTHATLETENTNIEEIIERDSLADQGHVNGGGHQGETGKVFINIAEATT